MTGLYRSLARLLPERMRREYGRGLVATFEERARALPRARSARLAFAVRECADLVRTAVVERYADWRGGRGPRPARRSRGETLVHDLAVALRRLRRQPGFTLVAVLTLALGIGANTAMFSVIHAVLLRPLPYRDAGELVRIRFTQGVADTGSMEASLPDLRDWQPEVSALSGLAAYASTSGGSVVDFGEEAEVVPSGLVTWNLFDVLGVSPLIGRSLVAGDDVWGAEPVALIGEGLWRRRFGGSPDALGRTVRVGGSDHAIVGVMPADADYPVGSRLWLPVVAAVDPQLTDNRQIAFLNVVGRLAPGATPDSASAELNGIVERVTHPKHPPEKRNAAVFSPLREEILGDVRGPLWVSMAAALLVLAVACANVANLQIVRSLARRRERAVRRALGAGSGRLIGESLVESALLAGLGALAGVALAWTSLPALMAMSPVALFRGETVAVDAGAIAFAIALAALIALTAGVIPIAHGWRARLSEALGHGARVGGGSRSQGAFVVVQVALALVLLVGAGLLVRSFVELQRVDTGFERERTLMADVALLGDGYDDPAEQVRFFERLIARVEALPGVEAAGAVLARPFRGPNGFDAAFAIEGRRPEEQAGYPFLNYEAVTPGYLDAAGIPLLAGRGFADSDDGEGQPVAIVSRSVAERFWPDGALGERLKWGGSEGEAPWVTIVGVAGDARYRGVERVSLDAYVPARQSSWPPRTLAVRSAGDPAALLASIRGELRRLEPEARAVDAATTGELISASLQPQRFHAAILGLFGALALVIGAVGVFGVLSYDMALRTRELGVRMALGASRRAVLELALGRGLRLTGAGMLLGLAGAVAASRLVSAQLFGVAATDARTFLTASLLLLGAGAAASLLPARRASRVDPLVALREE